MTCWLPVRPLIEHIGQVWRDDDTGRNYRLSPASSLVDHIGLARHTTAGNRWQRRFDRALQSGRIRLEYGEDACDLLGIHPTAVWGHDYYSAAGLSVDGWSVDDERLQMPPEDEPGGQFCGRPTDWRAIGHEKHYGLYDGVL